MVPHSPVITNEEIYNSDLITLLGIDLLHRLPLGGPSAGGL